MATEEDMSALWALVVEKLDTQAVAQALGTLARRGVDPAGFRQDRAGRLRCAAEAPLDGSLRGTPAAMRRRINPGPRPAATPTCGWPA